jgi:hypothetical protein
MGVLGKILDFDPIRELKKRGFLGNKKTTIVVERVKGSSYISSKLSSVVIDNAGPDVTAINESEVFVGKGHSIYAYDYSSVKFNKATGHVDAQGSSEIESTSDELVNKVVVSGNAKAVIPRTGRSIVSGNAKLKTNEAETLFVSGSPTVYIGKLNARIAVDSNERIEHEFNRAKVYIDNFGKDAMLMLQGGEQSIFINNMEGVVAQSDNEGKKKLYVKNYISGTFLGREATTPGELYAENTNYIHLKNGWDAVVLNADEGVVVEENSALLAKSIERDASISGESYIGAETVFGNIFKKDDISKIAVDNFKGRVFGSKINVNNNLDMALEAKLPAEYYDGMREIASNFPDSGRRFSRKDTGTSKACPTPSMWTPAIPVRQLSLRLRTPFRWLMKSMLITRRLPKTSSLNTGTNCLTRSVHSCPQQLMEPVLPPRKQSLTWRSG